MNPMLFINGRFLTQPVTGVQRYAIELFDALDALLAGGNLDQQGIDLACLVPPDYRGHPGWQRIEVRRVGSRAGNLWEQVDLPWHARGGVLFSPANIGPFWHPEQVVTIHDASVVAFPRAYSFAFRTKYRLTYQRLAHVARAIITVSEFSKQELARRCHVPTARVTVIPHGSSHLAGVAPDPTILARTGLAGKTYFLAVGSQSPHKNFASLMAAFRRLNRPDVELALVGGTFNRVFQSTKADLPPRTHPLGYVTDGELRALYQHAAGFVFPSFYEGFGLPVLEAMSAGCPVLCSNAASLPEVGGEAVLYCDPQDPADIAAQMERLLDDAALRSALIHKGIQRAGQFSWETAARRTWDVLARR